MLAKALATAVLIVASCLTAPAQTRSITVVTEPNTRVWIDGVLYGKTGEDGRLTISSIAAGAHTLRARAKGFKERSQPLSAAARGEVKVTLVKTTDEADLAFEEAERLTSLDRERAADAFNKAIKARPNFPEAYVALARVLADSGDGEGSLKAIASAKRLRPVYPEASAVLGRIHKDNGDEAKAIAAFKKAITEGKGFQPEAYTGLGLLYKEKAEGFGSSGDFENEAANYAEATKNLKAALKQLSGAPDAIVIYQLLGLIYERQKRYAEAIATYEDFLRFFPDVTEATAVRSFIEQLKKAQADPQ